MNNVNELMKRINALFLVVDSTVATDIHKHVLDLVEECEALRREKQELKYEIEGLEDDIYELKYHM